jgi:hypothetical protein
MKRLLLSTTLLVWAGMAQAQSIESATITPDGGSITDAQGHQWVISPSGSIQKDGEWVAGGGGTAALTIGADGTVYGLDDGHGPINAGGWFTLSGDGQNWAPSADPSVTPPPAVGPGNAVQPGMTTPPLSGAIHITRAVCGNGTPTGSFHVADGHLLGPDGKEWIARGINVADNDLGAADQMIAMFPGLNFVRLAIYQYRDPSFYAPFIDKMAARGTVVEIEHHVEPNGATGGGGQGATASGPWLAAENAFYSTVAAAFKSNPYVWFGTTNEPPGPAGLSAWQKETVNAIRGTGNTNPILLQANGWAVGGEPVMLQGYDTSAYSNMKNVVWDVHYYGWLTGYSTDQQKSDDFLAKMIAQVNKVRSADGSIPAMVVEFGPSTTGQSLDANGSQTVDAVINSSAANQPINNGNAAWHWGMQDCCNNLNSGSSLTEMGQKVAMYIGTSVQPCTAQQIADNAALNLAEITQQATAADPTQPVSPPDTPASATPPVDPVIQSQSDAADATIAQANAILAAAKAQLQTNTNP